MSFFKNLLSHTGISAGDNITAHFTWHEFQCHNGIQVPSEYQDNVILLCKQLEIIHSVLELPITILCGYRTVAYNDMLRRTDPKVAQYSQHCKGKAADIQVPGYTSLKLYGQILDLINRGLILQGGLGLYNDFCHYDIRGFPSRWDYRTKK